MLRNSLPFSLDRHPSRSFWHSKGAPETIAEGEDLPVVVNVVSMMNRVVL